MAHSAKGKPLRFIHGRDALRWTQGGEQGRTTEIAGNDFFVCRGL